MTAPIHERQALRAAVVAQLKGTTNTATAALDRVFPNRIAPLKVAQLPALLVYVESELVTDGAINTSPRELKREAAVKVEGWVMTAPGTPPDDALDALALQIEAAMDSDPHLDGNAYDSYLTDTAIDINNEGEQVLSCITLTYACAYHTQQRRALPTADFVTAGVTTNVGGTQADADDLESVVTIP